MEIDSRLRRAVDKLSSVIRQAIKPSETRPLADGPSAWISAAIDEWQKHTSSNVTDADVGYLKEFVRKAESLRTDELVQLHREAFELRGGYKLGKGDCVGWRGRALELMGLVDRICVIRDSVEREQE